jgi:hypothetical protein
VQLYYRICFLFNSIALYALQVRCYERIDERQVTVLTRGYTGEKECGTIGDMNGKALSDVTAHALDECNKAQACFPLVASLVTPSTHSTNSAVSDRTYEREVTCPQLS